MSRSIIGGMVKTYDTVFISSVYTDGEGIVETTIADIRRYSNPCGTRMLFKTRELVEEYDGLLSNDDHKGISEFFDKHYVNRRDDTPIVKDMVLSRRLRNYVFGRGL